MNNNTWFWRVAVSGIITIAIGLSAWTMNAVANMPKEYTTKEEFRQLRKENRQDHQRILDGLNRIRRVGSDANDVQ